MKKLLIVIALLLSAGLLFAGGSQGAGESKQEPVTVRLVTYWTAASTFAVHFEEVKAAMEKEYPHLTLNNEGYESAAARDKYAVEFASGSPPDISQLAQSFAREYVKQGLLLDLMPFIEKDAEWKDSYVPSVWPSFAPDGKMHLSPLGTNWGTMFYNKRVLADAGISEPAEDWNALMTYIGKIKATGKIPWLTGGKEYRWAWLLTQMMVRTSGTKTMAEMATGDEIMGWDKPENGFVHTMELFDELVKAEAFPKDVNALPRDVATAMFARDEGAIWYEGTWMINNFVKSGGENFDRDVLMVGQFPKIPGAKGDQVGGLSGPLGMAVSSKTSGEQQRLAVEFVKRISSTDIATRYLEATSHGSMIKVVDPDWSKISPILAEVLKTYEKLPVVGLPSDVYFAPPVDNAIKKIAAPAVVEGTMTPMQAAQEVNRRAISYFKP